MKFSRYLVGLIALAGIGSFALAQEQSVALTGIDRAYKHGIGTYLVDQHGLTLYAMSAEPDSDSDVWQPVTMGANLDTGPGVDLHLVGASGSAGEAILFTYGGLPLYRFTGDSVAGDLNGHGWGGSAYAVGENGQPIGANAAQFAAGPATERIDRAYKFGTGTFLVDAQGFSLYASTGDEPAIDVAWPPLISAADTAVGDGLNADLLDTVMHADGSEQLTYAGYSLHRFSGDDDVGDVSGQGASDSWFLVSADGTLLADAADVSATAEAAETEAAAEQQEVQPETVARADVPADVMNLGATVFSSGTNPSCASCHGADGEGESGPSLHANSALENDERIIRTVLRGGHIMPAFGSQLTDERVAAVLTFIRNSWDNDLGVISPDEVTSNR